MSIFEINILFHSTLYTVFFVISLCIFMDGQLIGDRRKRKRAAEKSVLISYDRNCGGGSE